MSTDSPDLAAQLAEHLHLVHRIVAQFMRRLPRSVQREDLVAAGTLGLFQALKTSGHTLATCEEMFTAYARIRIRGAILDELRRHDWSPRRRRSPQVEEKKEASKAPAIDPIIRGSIAPPPGARAANDTIPPPAAEGRAPVHVIGFDDLSPQALGSFLFDSSMGNGPSAGSGVTTGWGTRSPLDELEEKVNCSKLHACVAKLPERERDIIRMRYFEGFSSKAIATALGLSEARISQLHTRATTRLRAILAEEGVDVGIAA